MRNDRELLELAAKAAGIHIHSWNFAGYAIIAGADGRPTGWNPILDGGDALRLAVKLGLALIIDNGYTTCHKQVKYCHAVAWGRNSETATYYAIVLVAADIGETMP